MINTSLTFLKNRTLDFLGEKVYYNELSFPNLEENVCYIGIDPGTVNFGFCILTNKIAKVFQAKLVRDSNPILRMIGTKKLLTFFWNNSLNPAYLYQFDKKGICIEGASFGDVYRQVELAEIRASAVLWSVDLFNYGEVNLIPPSKIRKKVFGNGSIIGKEVWKKQLPPDAADALACAYYLVNM